MLVFFFPFFKNLGSYVYDSMRARAYGFVCERHQRYSQAVNTRATFPPTCQIGRHQVKKLSMEAAGCFWCVNRLRSPPKSVSAEKLPEKVARLCRTLLNSNRGITVYSVTTCTCACTFLHSKNCNRKYGQYFTEGKALMQCKEYRLHLCVHYADSSTTAR